MGDGLHLLTGASAAALAWTSASCLIAAVDTPALALVTRVLGTAAGLRLQWLFHHD